jgi:hypothetical protein
MKLMTTNSPTAGTLNAPSHPIRNRLLRITCDSPGLLTSINQEGKA